MRAHFRLPDNKLLDDKKKHAESFQRAFLLPLFSVVLVGEGAYSVLRGETSLQRLVVFKTLHMLSQTKRLWRHGGCCHR
jgi:hypothetical protein